VGYPAFWFYCFLVSDNGFQVYMEGLKVMRGGFFSDRQNRAVHLGAISGWRLLWKWKKETGAEHFSSPKSTIRLVPHRAGRRGPTGSRASQRMMGRDAAIDGQQLQQLPGSLRFIFVLKPLGNGPGADTGVHDAVDLWCCAAGESGDLRRRWASTPG